MKDKYEELFEFTHHFNKKIIESFEFHMDQIPDRALLLINHSLNAHQIWLSRILKEKPFGVWEIHPWKNIEGINPLNYQKSLWVLENFDLKQLIQYRNSKGDSFENKIEDILFHIINHTTYHRGQIMVSFREAGIEPIPSDYIFYKR